MARKSNKVNLKKLDLEDDAPLETTPQATVYVRIEKHSRPYRGLAAEQWTAKKTSKQGNIIIGDREFEMGRTYQVPATPAIKDAIAKKYLNAGGKFHFIGNTGEMPKKPMLISKKATEKAEKPRKTMNFGDSDD